MQRKRGEVVSGLDDELVPAIRNDSPQARHSFTVADQVNQLVSAREADPDRGFMARMMALCSLPRTNPGNRHRYVRRNGPYTLVMSAGGLCKLPYGNLPRLLIAWLCTEAVRTQSRELALGRSLSEFMRTLGVYSSAGGVANRLRNQMDRLFSATVQLIYEDERGKATVNSLIADSTEFWWNPKRPDESTLWESKIELSEKFFQEIISHPVPIDMNTLAALKRCALGLDLYLWLTYRMFTLRAPLRLPWRHLYHQFGLHPDKASDKRTVLNFRSQALRGVEEDQAGLAGVELHHGSGPPDPLAFNSAHPTFGSPSTSKLGSQVRCSRRENRP